MDDKLRVVTKPMEVRVMEMLLNRDEQLNSVYEEDTDTRHWLDRDYWTTKDKRIMQPEEFDNWHLLHTIHYIQRRVLPNAKNMRLTENMLWTLSLPDTSQMGDAAGLAVEQATWYETLIRSKLTDLEWLASKLIYKLLVEEATRRTLVK